MRVKNVCGKIINFGLTALLPGESCELPKEFEGNPVIDACIENDNLVVLMESPVSAADKAKVSADVEDIAKKKKSELIDMCEKLGLPGSQENTKAELITMILDATK